MPAPEKNSDKYILFIFYTILSSGSTTDFACCHISGDTKVTFNILLFLEHCTTQFISIFTCFPYSGEMRETNKSIRIRLKHEAQLIIMVVCAPTITFCHTVLTGLLALFQYFDKSPHCRSFE